MSKLKYADTCSRWGVFEAVLEGPKEGNPFTQQWIRATFSGKNETVIEYNNAAKALMKTEGVTVNDLYEFCIKHPTCYKCEDLLHHSHEGNLACAKVIAEAIKKELNIND